MKTLMSDAFYTLVSALILTSGAWLPYLYVEKWRPWKAENDSRYGTRCHHNYTDKRKQ